MYRSLKKNMQTKSIWANRLAQKESKVYLNKKNTLNSVCDFSMAYVSLTINKKEKKALLKWIEY